MTKTTDTKAAIVRTNVALPAELHKRLRLAAFEAETSATAIIVAAVTAWLDARQAERDNSDPGYCNCIDGPDGCHGPVELRPAGGGGHRCYERCLAHAREALDSNRPLPASAVERAQLRRWNVLDAELSAAEHDDGNDPVCECCED